MDHNNLVQFARAKATGTGPLVSNVGEGGGFWRSRDDLPAPDLQPVHTRGHGVELGRVVVSISGCQRGSVERSRTEPRLATGSLAEHVAGPGLPTMEAWGDNPDGRAGG